MGNTKLSLFLQLLKKIVVDDRGFYFFFYFFVLILLFEGDVFMVSIYGNFENVSMGTPHTPSFHFGIVLMEALKK